MALIDDNRQLAGAIFLNRVIRSTYDLLGTLSAWNDARATRKALTALTARELDDIGLSRADIDLICERGGSRF